MPYTSEGDVVFYGSQQFFPLLRFVFTTYERLLFARVQIRAKLDKDLAALEEENREMADGLRTKKEELIMCREQLVLKALYTFSQSQEPGAYEDFLRSFVGPEAYVLFTFDKTLNLALKSLQTLAGEECNLRALRRHPVLSQLPEPLYYENHLEMSKSQP